VPLATGDVADLSPTKKELMMKKMLIIIALLVGLAGKILAAEDLPDDSVDHLSLATMMVYDAKYDRARDELNLVDQKKSDFDPARYFTIKGVLASKIHNDQSAIENFLKAIEATRAKDFSAPNARQNRQYLFSVGRGEKKEQIPKIDGAKVKQEKMEKLYIYLSQSYYHLGEYAKTVESLDLAGSRGRNRPTLFLLRAECYWKIKDTHRAIDTLNRGTTLFPEDPTLWQQKTRYFSELKLYQAAIESAKKTMVMSGVGETDFIFLAQLYAQAHRWDEAIHLLEKIQARFPASASIPMLLGQFYLKKGMPYTTASFFQAGAYRDGKYLQDAVEMMRRIKAYPRSIFLNSLMTDKIEKLRQKVAIFLDLGEYEKVIGLKDGLERYNILDDDSMRYAFAYASFMAKDYAAAEEYLGLINDQDLFMKGTVIRNNIERCRIDSLECL